MRKLTAEADDADQLLTPQSCGLACHPHKRGGYVTLFLSPLNPDSVVTQLDHTKFIFCMIHIFRDLMILKSSPEHQQQERWEMWFLAFLSL